MAKVCIEHRETEFPALRRYRELLEGKITRQQYSEIKMDELSSRTTKIEATALAVNKAPKLSRV